MAQVHWLDRRGSHVLVERDGFFAVIEERNGEVYSLQAKHRHGFPKTEEGVFAATGPTAWRSEMAARRLFDEITLRAEDLAQRMR